MSTASWCVSDGSRIRDPEQIFLTIEAIHRQAQPERRTDSDGRIGVSVRSIESAPGPAYWEVDGESVLVPGSAFQEWSEAANNPANPLWQGVRTFFGFSDPQEKAAAKLDGYARAALQNARIARDYDGSMSPNEIDQGFISAWSEYKAMEGQDVVAGGGLVLEATGLGAMLKRGGTLLQKTIPRLGSGVLRESTQESAETILRRSVTRAPNNAPKEVAGIRGFTKHGLNRAIQRGVKPVDILDAMRNPLKRNPVKVDQLGRESQRIIGRKAEIVINPQTKEIISVNPLSAKKLNRLLRQLGTE